MKSVFYGMVKRICLELCKATLFVFRKKETKSLKIHHLKGKFIVKIFSKKITKLNEYFQNIESDSSLSKFGLHKF